MILLTNLNITHLPFFFKVQTKIAKLLAIPHPLIINVSQLAIAAPIILYLISQLIIFLNFP